MSTEEKDLELTLLGVKVPRKPWEASRPGYYWYITRAGYNMAIFKNLADLDDPKPYEWNCSTYGCSFTDSGKEASLEDAVKEAHVHLARYLLDRSETEQYAIGFLVDGPPEGNQCCDALSNH